MKKLALLFLCWPLTSLAMEKKADVPAAKKIDQQELLDSVHDTRLENFEQLIEKVKTKTNDLQGDTGLLMVLKTIYDIPLADSLNKLELLLKANAGINATDAKTKVLEIIEDRIAQRQLLISNLAKAQMERGYFRTSERSKQTDKGWSEAASNEIQQYESARKIIKNAYK